jgi:hypothetical protein
VGEVALAPEQESAELVLQLLDGAGERRLGDVTLLGRAGEVQGLAYREEVADLMHLHRGASISLVARRRWPGAMTRSHEFNANTAFPLWTSTRSNPHQPP